MNGLVGFAKHWLGIELYPGQIEVLEQWGASGRRKILMCVGRRSGKGLMAAVAAIYNAYMEDYSGSYQRPGEERFIVVVANRDEQAQEFIRMVREVLENAIDPELVTAVDWERCTMKEIRFSHGVVIRAMPCSARSTRGLPISLLILDECGHFQTDTDGVGAGKLVYQALEPSLSQFMDKGYLMFTSTPMWRAGLFWEQYNAGLDGKDPELLVIKRATWEMNPKITRASLEPRFRIDHDGAATEYGADFSAAEGAFLDIEDIKACQRMTGTIQPDPKKSYRAAIDPAYEKDAFAMAVGHSEDGAYVIDGVWTWVRQGHDATLDQVVALAKSYGVRSVRTDQYGSTPIEDGLAKRGLSCEVMTWVNSKSGRFTSLDNRLNKYDAFAKLKTGLATRTISLPHDDYLEQELIHLESKRTKTGMIWIGASAGNHDDRATVLAALVDALYSQRAVLVGTVDFDPDHGDIDPFAQFDTDDD